MNALVYRNIGFDDENNNVGAQKIGSYAIIPIRYVDVSMWKTHGIDRK
jgi:hypothetical protein